MVNERYLDFLKFALHRTTEIALFYEKQAKQCSHPANKLFLYYLAGKKRVQQVMLEMVAASTKERNLVGLHHPVPGTNSTGGQGEQLSNANAPTILRFARERAEKDRNLFVSLAALEEDPQTKHLLTTLSKLSREFVSDVIEGFARIAGRNNSARAKSSPAIICSTESVAW